MTTANPNKIPNLISVGFEALAQIICDGPGGYRTGTKLTELFRAAGHSHLSIGQSSRVPATQFALENMESQGKLGAFLEFLCDPRQYPGDPNTHLAVAEAFNTILKPYGRRLVIAPDNLSAKIQIILPGVPTPLVTPSALFTKPDFGKFLTDPKMISLLDERWDEVARLHPVSPRFTVIALGAVLEGALLGRVKQDTSSMATANKSTKVPKKNGQPKSFGEWTLAELIDVATDVGWIDPARARFSHAVRDYRNYIHPNKEITEAHAIDQATSDLTLAAVKAAFSDLEKP